MLNPELWKPVVGFEGLYSVSKLGDVYSHHRNRLLKTTPSSTTGYRVVWLCSEGKRTPKSVHRLVLEAFVGPCPDGMEALHGPDPDRANARLDNLHWGTLGKNQGEDRARDHTTNRGEKCGSAKLTWEQVQELKSRRRAGEQVAALGEAYGINPSTVSKICNDKRWQYAPSEW